MTEIDVGNPNEVENPQMLDMLVGTPPVRMLIYTGIVKHPTNDDDDNGTADTIVVKFKETATQLIGYTATIGLASIHSDDEDFIFATNRVSVDIDQSDGRLVLKADVFAQGDFGHLNRFSYQANVIVDMEGTLISGTIRWNRNIIQHTREINLFQTISSFISHDPPPGSIIGWDELIPPPGTQVGHPILIGDFYEVPYVIMNPRLNAQLHVKAEPTKDAFLVQPRYQLGGVRQISGPIPIILTPRHSQEQNVNLELGFTEVPR